MEINNKDSYYNALYQAVIVDSDLNDDPLLNNRVQIYIPEVHYKYMNDYKNYMNDNNKKEHELYACFPWAKSLVADLTEGQIVYCGCVDNENGNYIVLGVDVNNTSGALNDGTTIAVVQGGQVLELALPIIIHNEVGIAISDWPNNISSDLYTKINPSDNGGWSIGLIQWHHTRAYDVLYYIAKNDPTWESCWPDKSYDLYIDLSNSLKSGNTSARTKYQKSFKPSVGSGLYNSIKNMLGTEVGKRCQREYATQDTLEALNILQNETYNIQNPALLIYLLDIMNQYGNGISSKAKASEYSHETDLSNMQQLEKFRRYWKLATLGAYNNRRETTYQYIVSLDVAGKLNQTDLVSVEGIGNVNLGNGQYCYPFIGSFSITSLYGWRGAIAGTNHSGANFHHGVDFGCPRGTTLVACTSGTVSTVGYDEDGYGNYVRIVADDGNIIYYGHLQSYVVSQGQKVVKGTVLGYSDDTGNSSGNHLHFEIRKSTGKQADSMDPLPFLGCEGYKKGQYVGSE